MTEDTAKGELIDWTTASMSPMFAGGFVLELEGVSPVPVTVHLDPAPIGVVEQEYNQVSVRATTSEDVPEVVTPWNLSWPNAEKFSGTVGFELVGLTKREFFPPADNK